MLFSVLIISHNQKEQLRRCVDSVLGQDLPFEHEIIISDDASTDGTRELAQEYARKYKQVKVFLCNSDDCQPTITSERSGHNRSNAYNHSSGKYFCHIDADDFYRPGTNCLQEMVKLLESHPDCSICMQNGWILQDGRTLEEGHPYYKEHRFQTGEILTPEQYFKSGLFVNNGAMVMRRNESVNPADYYHKWYVDSVITNHHLQFGNIVCLNSADWVYVQYPKSITSSLSANDQRLLWCIDTTAFAAIMVPHFKPYYYSPPYLQDLQAVCSSILNRDSYTLNAIHFCRQFSEIFLFRAACKESLSLFDIIRLKSIRFLTKISSRFPSSVRVFFLDNLCGTANREIR